jgi:hypothetical protein
VPSNFPPRWSAGAILSTGHRSDSDQAHETRGSKRALPVRLTSTRRIEFATSAADPREGGRPIFGCFDQTETWNPSNGGTKLAAAVRRNPTKTGGSSIETPNAYRPGLKSVAEKPPRARHRRSADTWAGCSAARFGWTGGGTRCGLRRVLLAVFDEGVRSKR